MRSQSFSLGTKLNLALLAFLLVLAAAMSAIILFGFNRTQDNANERSRQALEEEGKLALTALVAGVEDAGALQLENAGAIGQRSSRYLSDYKASYGNAAVDTSRFVQTAEGVWYDPDPARGSDVIVPNHVPSLSAAMIDDITYSAPLDVLYASLAGTIPNQISGEAFRPIAIIFVGMNGVGRYYPPIGIHETTPADVDISDLYDRFGPVANPDRATSWTPPYEDLQGRGLVITARTPIYEGETFRGLFEVDLSIERLVEQLNVIKPTDSGFTFYVDNEGGILRTNSYDLLTGEAKRSTAVASMLDNMKTPDPTSGVLTEEVTLAGRDYFIARMPMALLGGSIAVAAPVDEVTGQAALITKGIDEEGTRTFWIMLAAMAGLFVLGLAGATWLNRRLLVAPVQKLGAATQAVAGGDLETKVTLQRGDELGTLADSFNTMVEQLRSRNETLIERESQYRSVFEATSDGLLLFTAEGELVEVNPACCEMHGYTREEFLELPPSNFIHAEDMPHFAQFLATAAGGEFRTRARNIRKDGTGFPVDVRGRPFAWMGKTLLMAVVRDITQEVESEHLLEERVEARTRELDALLRADAELFRSLDLNEVLKALVDVAVDVLGVHKSLVSIWDPERGTAVVRAVRNIGPDSLAVLQGWLANMGHSGPANDYPPMFYDVDVTQVLPPELLEATEREGVKATTDIPIRSPQGTVLGGFGVMYTEPHTFSGDEQRVLVALADRAAVAIENAELYSRAQQAASLEERQRLARELHDSVSQALYGIALGARTAREQLDRDPAKAAEPIDYVLSLAEAGLAEMRALIFELRPESLESEGVVAALEKQVAATQARFGIAVDASFCDEPDAPIEVKEALYRVGQEALHNVVKHANAQHASLSLKREDGAITLEVRDDGVGFDANADYAGHLGLRSMRERVERRRGQITIDSRPGGGSRVVVRVPV